MLVTSIFSFSQTVFYRLPTDGCEKSAECGKMLSLMKGQLLRKVILILECRYVISTFLLPATDPVLHTDMLTSISSNTDCAFRLHHTDIKIMVTKEEDFHALLGVLYGPVEKV